MNRCELSWFKIQSCLPVNLMTPAFDDAGKGKFFFVQRFDSGTV